MWTKFERISVASVLLLALLGVGQASAQCILANPSFEILGSSGEVFGGWNQFGSYGWVGEASHGSRAARLTGWGSWDVSGFWQAHDAGPGERFEVTGHVQNPSSAPLAGGSVALVNVEWWDAGGNMLDYDSFSVANSSTPTDSYIPFSVTSSPAPAGTVQARLLVGILQSPGDPSGNVYFDQVTFFSTSSPTIDDVQWNDFPGGRTISFGGHSWRVKGTGFYGPGPNLFSDSVNHVWVDAQDKLHLTLKQSGSWYSSEVVIEEALGYGDYVLTTEGRLDLLDPHAVLGIFLWEYGPCWDYGYTWWNAFNEIDIEYSRWGNPAQDIAQFVAQPWEWGGNRLRFDVSFSDGELVSHAMRWLPDRVEYRVWRGGPNDEAPQNMVRSWTYTGYHVPRPEQPRMHLNLWRFENNPASDQEVVFTDFNFTPEGESTGTTPRVPPSAAAKLHPAVPNPFNPETTLRFELRRGGVARLDVYDLAGRHVRSLEERFFDAGEHETVWRGRDASGQRVASGVYIVRLQGDGFNQTRRVALLK